MAKEAKRRAEEKRKAEKKEEKRLAEEEKRLADEEAAKRLAKDEEVNSESLRSSPPPDDSVPMVTDAKSDVEDVESSSSTLIYLCVASVCVIAASIGYKRIRNRFSDQEDDNRRSMNGFPSEKVGTMFVTQGSTEIERESEYSDVSDIYGTILGSRTSTEL